MDRQVPEAWSASTGGRGETAEGAGSELKWWHLDASRNKPEMSKPRGDGKKDQRRKEKRNPEYMFGLSRAGQEGASPCACRACPMTRPEIEDPARVVPKYFGFRTPILPSKPPM